MKLSLLLILKLIYFSNSFCMTFILRFNLPSFWIIDVDHNFLDCEIQQEFYDLV